MKVNRVLMSLVLMLTLAGSGQPLAAQTVAECYEKVLAMCSDAMDGAKWYEKFAIGLMCSGMLAGCNTQVVL